MAKVILAIAHQPITRKKEFMKRVSILFAALWIVLPAHAADFAANVGIVNALYTVFGGMLGIVLGAWGNHKLSLYRDRRKEFNEISDPVRVALKSERRSVNIHYSHLDADAVSILADILGGKEGAALDAAVERYKEARQQWVVVDEQYGTPSYSQTVHVEQAIDAILRHLRRR
jgi:hypothetical protein